MPVIMLEQIKENYYDLGIRIFWLDEAELSSPIMNTAIIDITWVLYWKWATSIQSCTPEWLVKG